MQKENLTSRLARPVEIRTGSTVEIRSGAGIGTTQTCRVSSRPVSTSSGCQSDLKVLRTDRDARVLVRLRECHYQAATADGLNERPGRTIEKILTRLSGARALNRASNRAACLFQERVAVET